MRSSGGTNFGLERSVVARTKSTIACFAGPSFHEASVFAASCAHAVVAPSHSAGKTTTVASSVRRLIEDAVGFMIFLFHRVPMQTLQFHLLANQRQPHSNSCEQSMWDAQRLRVESGKEEIGN
jgi:hypothetical protein